MQVKARNIIDPEEHVIGCGLLTRIEHNLIFGRIKIQFSKNEMNHTWPSYVYECIYYKMQAFVVVTGVKNLYEGLKKIVKK